MVVKMNIIIISAIVMGLLGFFFALILSYASKKFSLKEDPRVKKVLGVLPGANCGACGYASCEELAKAIVEGKVDYNSCKIGKEKVAAKIKKVLKEKV